MGEQAPLRAASIREAARIFSLPARALYSAVRANEVTLHRSSGSRGVLILSDVERWLRARGPASTRTRMTLQDGDARHGG
jgi:hypothetical protein